MSVGAATSLYAVQFVGTGGTGYACTHDLAGGSTLYKTTDAGASWQPVALPGSGEQANSLSFASESIGFVAGLRGYAVKTVDGATNLAYMNPGVIRDFHGVGFVRNNASTAFIVAQ